MRCTHCEKQFNSVEGFATHLKNNHDEYAVERTPHEELLDTIIDIRSSQKHDEHYRNMAIEPMHRSLENDLDAAQHTICKYVERHKVKKGVRDLEAARDLLIDYIDYVKYGTWKGKRMVMSDPSVSEC